jgi:glycosyltransferase involved in cell wall biosynthesis
MSYKILVSVVVPTKNEEVTISTFLEWCFEGFSNCNVDGEVILMDSSSDMTAEIARRAGATVIHVEGPGLGNAYLQAKGHINGEIVILGDADCTYDFREISDFLQKINEGCDLVMGSRFKGKIEVGAMPAHHQYFGSPGTTLFFRLLTGLKLTDIHCGMRALTRKHFEALPFLEKSWEYATEMIVASHNLGGNIGEVPIKFLKEPDGRESHHKRSGWMSPFRAGWGTLKTTCTYSLDRLMIFPGLTLGLLFYFIAMLRISVPSAFLKEAIGSSAGAAFVGLSMAGFSTFALGLVAGCLYDQTGKRLSVWINRFSKLPLFGFTVVSGLILLLLTFMTLFSWVNFTKNDESGSFVLTQIWIFSLGTFFNLFIVSSVYLLIKYLRSVRVSLE